MKLLRESLGSTYREEALNHCLLFYFSPLSVDEYELNSQRYSILLAKKLLLQKSVFTSPQRPFVIPRVGKHEFSSKSGSPWPEKKWFRRLLWHY